jgi:hypothetical protein
VKILITGDSWAGGEWPYCEGWCDRLPLPILAPLLETDGHEVITEFHPDGNDYLSLISIARNSKVDLTIFYKTCSTRSLRDIGEAKYILQNNDNDLMKSLLHIDNDIFRRLESLPSRVFLIGGLNKIVQDVNVEFIVPSLIEELTGEEVPQYCGQKDFFKTLKQIHTDKVIDDSQLQVGLDIMTSFENVVDIFSNYPEYFYPDWAHPNRQAIEHTYNLIKDKI